MNKVVLLHIFKSTREGYNGIIASHIRDKWWKNTNGRNRNQWAAAFMEASNRVEKAEFRIDEVAEAGV